MGTDDSVRRDVWVVHLRDKRDPRWLKGVVWWELYPKVEDTAFVRGTGRSEDDTEPIEDVAAAKWRDAEIDISGVVILQSLYFCDDSFDDGGVEFSTQRNSVHGFLAVFQVRVIESLKPFLL